MSRKFIAAVGCITSGFIACAAQDASDSDVGEVSLKVTTAPSDVHCVVLQASVTGRTVTKNIDVTPGQSILVPVSGLPTGTVSIGATAYAATCAALTSSSIPNWVSDPPMQTMTLARGTSVPLNVVLRPSSTVVPTLDWQDEAAAGGTSAGGTSSTGGAATGGAATGGAATGGAATGGAPAAVRCDNLSKAVGTTGQPKPTGTVGGLKVLDWAGFTGAVSFTFDDNNSSQIANYAQLNATGAHMTFYLVTSFANASNSIWQTAAADGHELGNHTRSHVSSASLSDLQAAEDFIQSTFGITAYTMASPNGDSSWISVAPQLMFLNRGVSDGLVAPRDGTNAFNLPAYIPPTGASSSTMDAAVNSAKTGNKWKIVLVHGFTGGTDGAYQPVSLSAMTTTMTNAVNNGLWTESVKNVGAYWVGQKAIPATATASATWTLPAHFPPNMCVRVSVTGGTVRQNGNEIPWDTHGYYQIALDAGSVTVQ